jgi:[protein-PII] uridylyltransferase
MPEAALVRGDLARALDGKLDLAERLAEKERAYAPHGSHVAHRRPTILWFDDATDATVVEFRGEDEIGLLFRIASALERAGLDVRSARVSSVAGAVVDAFYVTDQDGRPIAAAQRPRVESELRAAWPR